jgi:hypothetical protein
MATPANSSIDVCSRALILIGAEPITSFEDSTNEALVASNMYEDIARAALTNSRWRFATEQAILGLLSDAPTGRYDAAYQLPSNLIMLHAVTVNDSPIEYQTYGDKVFCDASSTETLIADYTFRAIEVDWPSYFTIAVEYTLASMFAVSIARDVQMAGMMEDKAAVSMAKARASDAQQQTSRKFNTNRFISQRRS